MVSAAAMDSSDRRNYPERAWWVAGFAEEFSRKPLRRFLLDQAIVLYRREDGGVVALEDRCVHRWAPLSMGRIEGDDVICPYHGFRFNPEGMCTHIPTQDRIPAKARVRSYRVIESAPFVWIWMGEGEPDKEIPATLPWASDDAWLTLGGAMPIACNYMLVQENVLDLTHFGFLHADTFQQPGWDAPPSEVTVEDGQVGYRQHFAAVQLAPFQAEPTGIGSEKQVSRTDWGSFVSPAIHVAGIDIVDPAPGANQRSHFSSRIVHATTPKSPGSCHYWWYFAQDYAIDDPEGKAKVLEIVEATFDEDKRLLEVIQETIDHDRKHDQSEEVSVGADRPGLQARRALQQLLAA